MEYSYSKEPKPQDIFYFFRNLNPVGKVFLGFCSLIFISLLFGGVYLYFFSKDNYQEPKLLLEKIEKEVEIHTRPVEVTPVSTTEVASISARKAEETDAGLEEPKESVVSERDIKTLVSKILILDLREPGEYKEGHIPEAVPLPVDIILRGEFSLPQDSAVVVYAERDLPPEFNEIKKKLQRAGVAEIQVLEGGYSEWKAGGNTIKSEDENLMF